MPDETAIPTTEQLQRFFDLSLELLIIGSGDGHFSVVNPAWEQTLGWTQAQLKSEPFLSFVHPHDQQDTATEMAAISAGSPAISFLNRMRTNDGAFRTLRWSATADESGRIYAVARDVTEFEDAVAASHRNEELWKAVLRTAADPIILIDEVGVMIRVNAATTSLFGYQKDQMLGQNVSMLMPEPYRSEHDAYLARYLSTGEARVIGIGREVEAQRADGTIFPMSLAVSDVDDDDGRKMYTGIIHDLSDRFAAEARLREANETLEANVASRTVELQASLAELARSNRDLEQFAYIASHDLKAPLRNVRQGIELLEDHLAQTVGATFDDEANELRQLTIDAVTRMENLIHGLLSFARVDRAGQRPDGTLNLGDLVDEVLQQLAADLGDVDATVEAEGLPTVQGDESQLRQLLQNLIQNSVKYRSADRPLTITLTAADHPDGWVISVADNGVGIDAAQHERVFELFRRAHSGYDGVGLGLAICQRIVERHGGTIWVESSPGAGATFKFTLPKEATNG